MSGTGAMNPFQKNLIVWKLQNFRSLVYHTSEVSEGLNSVETFEVTHVQVRVNRVSEGLNSVETALEIMWLARYATGVSEGLNSVETEFFDRNAEIVKGFRRT